MTKAKNYLVDFGHQVFHFTFKQFAMMLIGNLILAMGLAMFDKAAMGNHPFHTMVYSASQLLHHGEIDWYGTIFWIVNIFIFIPVLIVGKKHIGLGSIANMFLLGYAVEFCGWLLVKMGVDFTQVTPETTYLVPFLKLQTIWQLILELAATIVISLGISVYQAGDMGAAPYDAIPLIAVDKGKNFTPWRMSCDGACCLITLIELLILGFSNAHAQSMIGLGTVVTVFCTGPFIRFFDKTITKAILGK